MVRLPLILIALCGAGVVVHPATSATILQPDGVIAQPPMGELNASWDAGNLIDQSGLSANYASLVDDFDAYIGSNPTHNNTTDNTWLSTVGNPTGNLDFDLGGAFVVDRLALWVFGNNATSNIQDFTLLLDDDPAFASPANVGAFSAGSISDPQAAVQPQVFSFAPTTASHARVQITDNHGASLTSGGEVAFGVMLVPEPETWLLGAIAMLLLAILLRRSRKSVSTTV